MSNSTILYLVRLFKTILDQENALEFVRHKINDKRINLANAFFSIVNGNENVILIIIKIYYFKSYLN